MWKIAAGLKTTGLNDMAKNKMSEEEFKQLQLRAQEIHDIFYPRRNWSSPEAFHDAQTMRAIILMDVLRQTKHLTIEQGKAYEFNFKQYSLLGMRMPRYSSSLEERSFIEAHRDCGNRKGNPDIQYESWSAYRYLHKVCRGTKLSKLEEIPFGYWSEERKHAVTAGNVEPIRALMMIARKGILSFSVLSKMPFDLLDESKLLDDEDYDNHHYLMTTIKLTPRGLSEIQVLFGEE